MENNELSKAADVVVRMVKAGHHNYALAIYIVARRHGINKTELARELRRRATVKKDSKQLDLL
jgi:hypothetical protein